VRVATWNVNSLKARIGRVEEWVGVVAPDILCLQETKLADDAFPGLSFQALGYDCVHHGQGRWNGVAIASRLGLEEVRIGFGDDPKAAPADDPDARLVWATCGSVRIGCVYVPNGRELGHDHYTYKLEFLDRLHDLVRAEEDLTRPLLLCGDFNIAPDDRDVWDASAAHGGTHVSEPERSRLQALESLGLVDVFREHHDEPGLFSWWDYRGGNFHKKKGMRIDLMLVTRPLADAARSVLIDRNARKGQSPSDHAPLIADFEL
jgi:exodeoxyribonuclease-3